MKIVIDIPENVYKKLEHQQYYDVDVICNAILSGTPLPKHHGRLIDADEFHQMLEDMTIRDNDKWFNWLQRACIRLGEMPTIIEGSDADGE